MCSTPSWTMPVTSASLQRGSIAKDEAWTLHCQTFGRSFVGILGSSLDTFHRSLLKVFQMWRELFWSRLVCSCEAEGVLMILSYHTMHTVCSILEWILSFFLLIPLLGVNLHQVWFQHIRNLFSLYWNLQHIVKTKEERLEQVSSWNLEQDGIKKTYLQYLPLFAHQQNTSQLKKSER